MARHNAPCRSRRTSSCRSRVALATIALKTAAWWLTGSVGLLSDAMESFVNLAGAVFALAMVTIAAQPPDADHPYGHHKAEYFSSGFEGAADPRRGARRSCGPRCRGWPRRSRCRRSASAWRCRSSSSVLNGALAWAMLRKAPRAPLDRARGRCAPPVHRRLDLGRRRRRRGCGAASPAGSGSTRVIAIVVALQHRARRRAAGAGVRPTA